MSRTRVTVVLSVLVAACTGDGSKSPDGGKVDAALADAPSGDATPPGSLSLTFGPIQVASGGEGTQCVVKRLGNPAPFKVHQIHNLLGETSHHMIVYRSTDTEERPVPFDCSPFLHASSPDSGPIMITQKHDETLTLPEGVAFVFGANQMVRIEMHYINGTDDPLDVKATSVFTPIADEEFQHEAAFLFTGSLSVSVPARSTRTLGPIFCSWPESLADAKFFAVTGHTHQWGTDVKVATAPASTGPSTLVYDVKDWSWDEPETVYHQPPFQVPKGGGFQLTCSWNNLSKDPVGFGLGANDEMCFFWAYYYPSGGNVVFPNCG
jgi:hypothetical protein